MAHSPLVYRAAQEHLTFTEALEEAIAGKVIAREDERWDTESGCRCRFIEEKLCIFRKTEEDEKAIWHPWAITMGDVVGEDWVVVGGE